MPKLICTPTTGPGLKGAQYYGRHGLFAAAFQCCIGLCTANVWILFCSLAAGLLRDRVKELLEPTVKLRTIHSFALGGCWLVWRPTSYPPRQNSRQMVKLELRALRFSSWHELGN